jgi:hypothetical protein
MKLVMLNFAWVRNQFGQEWWGFFVSAIKGQFDSTLKPTTKNPYLLLRLSPTLKYHKSKYQQLI